MDVGNSLEECTLFLKYHQELIKKLNLKKGSIAEYLSKKDPKNQNLVLLWEDTDKHLEIRERLLQQGVKFHRSAKIVKKNLLSSFCKRIL
jgi:hypothetical protein